MPWGWLFRKRKCVPWKCPLKLFHYRLASSKAVGAMDAVAGSQQSSGRHGCGGRLSAKQWAQRRAFEQCWASMHAHVSALGVRHCLLLPGNRVGRCPTGQPPPFWAPSPRVAWAAVLAATWGSPKNWTNCLQSRAQAFVQTSRTAALTCSWGALGRGANSAACVDQKGAAPHCIGHPGEGTGAAPASACPAALAACPQPRRALAA